jgi:hypothetical protein
MALCSYAWTVSPAECPGTPFANASKEFPFEFATPYAIVPVFGYLFMVYFTERFVFKNTMKTNHTKISKS